MDLYIQAALAGAGIILVVFAIGWRMRAHRRAATRVRAALEDLDPATRLAALRVAGQRGLGEFADILVERARVETDDRVRRALADIVISNQWEPAVTQELVDLRLWAESVRPAASPYTEEPVRQEPVQQAAPPEETPMAEPPPLQEIPAASSPAAASAAGYGVHSGSADEEILREMGLMISGSALTGINVPAARSISEYQPSPQEPPPAAAPSDPPGVSTGPGVGGPGGPDPAAVGTPDSSFPGWVSGSGAGPVVAPAVGGTAPPDYAQYSSPSVRMPTGPERDRALLRPQTEHRSEFRPQGSGLRIIVTGAGGPAGVAVIRALTDLGYRVVGADPDGLSAGMRLAAEPAVVPKADDHTFVERLCDLAVKTGAKAVIPTVAEELLALSQGRGMLEQAGLLAWLPHPEAVLACIDKWRFAQQTAAAGIPIPTTNLGTARGVPGGWVVKPRFGRGSRDVCYVTRPEELDWALQRVPDPIVQTRLGGWEFTVDVLVDARGMLVGAVPRWRLETKAGISTRGRTFANDELVVGVARLVTSLGLVGAANVQGFMGPDGKFVFVEANPRFSGGLPLSLAAGADLVGEYVRGILGEPIRPDRLTYRPGVTMIRYFEEIFE